MKRLFTFFTLVLTATMLITSTSAAPRDEAEPGGWMLVKKADSLSKQ